MATALLGLGGSLIGTWLQGKAEEERRRYMESLLGPIRSNMQTTTDTLFGNQNGQQGIYNPLLNSASIDLGRFQDYLYGGDNGGAFGDLNNRINSAFTPEGLRQYLWNGGGVDPYGEATPGFGPGQNQLQGIFGNAGGMADIANAGFQGGGWTQDRANALLAAQGLMGGNIPGGEDANNIIRGFLGSAGQTAQTQGYRDRGMDALNSGGFTPGLTGIQQFAGGIANAPGTQATQGGLAAAAGMLQNQGMTSNLQGLQGLGANMLMSGGLSPRGAMAQDSALGTIGAGGENQMTQFAQGRGAQMLGREALMPTMQAMSIARDAAGRNAYQSAEANMRKALARGGPAATSSGLQNQAIAAASDQALMQENAAAADALMRQQQLQQQENQIGAGALQAGGGLANQRYGTAGSLFGNIENAANQRLGIGAGFITDPARIAAQREATGLSGMQGLGGLESQRQLQGLQLMLDPEQLATQRAGVYGNLGLGAGSEEINRLNAAGGLLGNMNSLRLGGLNAYNQGNSDLGQYALGLGGLANQGYGLQGNLTQNQVGNAFNAAGQGLNRLSQFYNLQNLGFGNQMNMLNFGQNAQNNARTTMGNVFSNLLDYNQYMNNLALTGGQGAAPSGRSNWGPMIASGLNTIGGMLPTGFGSSGSGGLNNLSLGPGARANQSIMGSYQGRTP